MLCIKTGMSSEEAIAKTYAPKDALVLSGIQTVGTLDKLVPKDCTGIISFGLCGGLGPSAQIGQAFIYDAVVIPSCYHLCSVAWRQRLFALTKYYECRCWSDGQFNTANSVEERAQLYIENDAKVIDDESRAIAEFAYERGLPFIGLRVVSDGAEDNLPPAVVNALNADGSANLWNVLESVVTDPAQIPDLVKTIGEYEKSIAELKRAALTISPSWGL